MTETTSDRQSGAPPADAPTRNHTSLSTRHRRSNGAATLGLVWTLVRTDFKSRYHGTLGGFVWSLVKPLATFIALIAVFSFIFPSESDYRINLLVGLFLYEFFSESTKTGMTSLRMKGFLLTKARFPTWILVLTSLSNAVIALTVFSTTLLVYLALIGRFPGLAHVALFGFYVLCFLLLVTGISLGSSVLFLRYRDLNQVWEVVVQAGFFLTPIFWPIGAIPEKFHFFLFLWPPTPFVDFTRQVLISSSLPSLRAHGFIVFESLLIFAVGALLYRRLSPRSAEYL